MYNSRLRNGLYYQNLGRINSDYDIVIFSQFIERLLFSDYSHLIILPREKYKIRAIREFTNEGFSLSGLLYLKNLEDFYFRNLVPLEQRLILHCMFKEVNTSD